VRVFFSPPQPLLAARKCAAWWLFACTAAALVGCDSDLPAPPRVAGGDVARGRLMLAQYQCGSCHQIPGVDNARGLTGPGLDVFGRRSYVAGFLPNYPDALVRWIVDPPALKPGTAMPAMGVSAEDARHMAAYLYSLE
jgi:cytochrome c1